MREITREMVEERHKEIAALVERGGRYNGKATANGAMRACACCGTNRRPHRHAGQPGEGSSVNGSTSPGASG